MTIKMLYPPLPERPFIEKRQCQAQPLDVSVPRLYGWRERRYGDKPCDPQRCQRHAQYEIDGKGYCSLHAGKIALHAGKIALHRWAAGKLVAKEPECVS